MAVVGVLFAGLAAATGFPPAWVAAAAINFIGAADAFLRWYSPPGPPAAAVACVG
jgi:hypothetical protein